MTSRKILLIGSIVASLFTLPAMAQPSPGMGGGMQGMGPGMMARGDGPGMRGPRDCKATPNPEACEARREAHRQAHEACKDKAPGAERRQCMREKMPPPDCSKAPNPQRCEQHQKAREACKDKAGPEHKACMREILRPQPGKAGTGQ